MRNRKIVDGVVIAVAVGLAAISCGPERSTDDCPEGYKCIPLDAVTEDGDSPDTSEGRDSGADSGADAAPQDTRPGEDGTESDAETGVADAGDAVDSDTTSDGDASTRCDSLPDPPGDNVVNLGDEGLESGDAIGPYLDQWFEDGNEVRIPAGEYEWNNQLGLTGVGNASIVGEGDVVWRRSDGATNGINLGATGDVEVRNITLRGEAGHRTLRMFASEPDAKLVLRNVEIPDGGSREYGHDPVGSFVPKAHAGEVWLIDMLVQNYPNNGLYANPPGLSGGNGGEVHVRRGLFRNNNISGVRIGSDGSSIKNTVIVNDSTPFSGGVNHRGLWLRQDADNMVVEDVHIHHAISNFNPYSAGGGVTVDGLYIYNESDNIAVKFGNNVEQTLTDIHLTGPGNLGVGSDPGADVSNVCRGDDCTEANNTKPVGCP